MVHRWTRGVDLVALLWILRQMLERSGSVEGFFVQGLSPDDPDVGAALDAFSARALSLDVRRAYGRKRLQGRLLLLPASVGRERVQAPEPVPAVDGPARRSRSRRVDSRPRLEADRPARHACDPARALPAIDALRQPGMEDGRGHHGGPQATRSGRSRALRFFAVPRRHDERVRLRQKTGRYPVSAERSVSSSGAGSALKLLAYVALLAAVVAGAWLLVVGRSDAHEWEVLSASAPGNTRIAFVRGTNCAAGVCQTLWIGPQTRNGDAGRHACRGQRTRGRDHVDHRWQARGRPRQRLPASSLRRREPRALPASSA